MNKSSTRLLFVKQNVDAPVPQITVELMKEIADIPMPQILGIFLLCRNSLHRFWCVIVWHFWIGRARQPWPGPQGVAVEVFNVGGSLTHGDFALDTETDYLVVVEDRLIPAGVRSEWSGLRGKGLASIWDPACQDSSHVGNAGAGVMLLCLPLPLLSSGASLTADEP